MSKLHIHNSLQKNIDNIDKKSYENIFFYIYSIKNINKIPHQLILMKKYNSNYSFFKLEDKKISINKSIKNIIKNVESIGVKKMNKAKKKIFTTEGYQIHDKNLYIFINVTNLVDIYTYTKNDKLIWTTKYEILNYKKIFNTKVEKETVLYFFNNYEQLTFENEKTNTIVYLEVNENNSVLELMNTFDKELNKFYCVHVQKIKNIKNIIRVVISNPILIIGNKFYFDKSHNLSILSIFE